MDFCNKYLGDVLYAGKDLWNDESYDAALYAEMLWTPGRDTAEMIEQVSKYPCVNYSNI